MTFNSPDAGSAFRGRKAGDGPGVEPASAPGGLPISRIRAAPGPVDAVGLRPVLYVFGVLLSVLALFMAVPVVLDAADGGVDWSAFSIAMAMTLFIGTALALANMERPIQLGRRQAFLLTTLVWVGFSAFAALPFTLSDLGLSFTDAFFEAMSGFTTTGSTVLVGLDGMPRGILIWRALLQWMGGIGIIVIAVAAMPVLKVGGMQLFRTESSDRSDKVFARVTDLAVSLVGVYGGLTATCAVLYWVGGMTPFEAIAHSMTTLSTGGYSTSDGSIGHFGPMVQWTGAAFMLAGGLPFVLYIRAVHGNPLSLLRDGQVRALACFLVFVIVGLTLWLSMARGFPIAEALRLATFNVVSIVTTTGYATTDYGLWGPFAVGVFFFLIFVGGCSGSTAGGIKIFRFQILGKIARSHLHTLILPHLVAPARYEGRAVTDEVVRSVIIFTFVFVGTVVALSLLLFAHGLDLTTSLSAAAQAVANVGPGLGEVVGPAGNYSSLPDVTKWGLAFGMLLGRLEFFTVLVVLTPRYWRV